MTTSVNETISEELSNNANNAPNVKTISTAASALKRHGKTTNNGDGMMSVANNIVTFGGS